jgi:hypothetical protein
MLARILIAFIGVSMGKVPLPHENEVEKVMRSTVKAKTSVCNGLAITHQV